MLLRILTPLFLVVFIATSCAQKRTEGVTYVDVQGAKELIKQKSDLIIVDVRTLSEIEDGTIPEATVIDVKSDDFQTRIETLDKERDYLVYCRSGRRSERAVKMMKAAGFANLYMMDGGYLAWKDSED